MFPTGNREKKSSSLTGFGERAYIGYQVWAVLDEPLHPLLEAWKLFQKVRLQGLHGKERDQANKGPDPERYKGTIWEVEDVIVEPILLVPQTNGCATQMVDSIGDVEKMLKELGGHILIGRLGAGQLQGNGQHVETVHAHPRRAISLIDVPTGGQRRTAVKDADVVQPEKTTLENIVAVVVLAVDPPGKVQQ